MMATAVYETAHQHWMKKTKGKWRERLVRLGIRGAGYRVIFYFWSNFWTKRDLCQTTVQKDYTWYLNIWDSMQITAEHLNHQHYPITNTLKLSSCIHAQVFYITYTSSIISLQYYILLQSDIIICSNYSKCCNCLRYQLQYRAIFDWHWSNHV